MQFFGSAKPRAFFRSRSYFARSVKYEASAKSMLEGFPVIGDVYGEQSRSHDSIKTGRR
jgi:hypothetical protein